MTIRPAATALLVGALCAVSAAGGANSPTAVVVDRTWSCPVSTSDGRRTVRIAAVPGAPSTADATVWVIDERPSPVTLVLATRIGLRVSRGCAATTRIDLDRRGLPGPPGTFDTTHDCNSQHRKVLVRVRAVVAASGPWRPGLPAHLDLKTQVSRAEVVVQAPNGKRFAYATIAGGKLQVWTSRSCVAR